MCRHRDSEGREPPAGAARKLGRKQRELGRKQRELETFRMANVAAGVATVALTGIAALPYALRALVRKRMPAATGPHAVGSCVQRDSTGLVVRVFYPLEDCAGEPESAWLPAPQSLYIGAIGAFLNLPSAVAGWLLAPGLRAVRGAWAEQSQPGALPAGDELLPVVCFSHGLGAFQNVYSLLCCELASRGVVVVVPEHADRSACATTYPDDGSPLFCERSSPARMVNPSTGEHDGGFSWRNGQIHERVKQVFGALGWLLESASDTGHVWHGRLDTKNVVMAGHSFGGATAVAACAAAPPHSGGPASIPARLGFAGFRCGVVLDGWLFPVVGDGAEVDTRQIDRSFGHPDFGTEVTRQPAAEATPLLFLDAASFLGDQRWWEAKEELVNRSNGSQGHGSSALLNLSYSVHHSFSDVLIVGEQAMGLIKKLQRDNRRNLKRGGVADEKAGAPPGRALTVPSAEDLHAEVVQLMLQFISSHTFSTESAEDESAGGAAKWAQHLSQRNDGAWLILAAGDKLGMVVNYSASTAAKI